MKHYEIAEWLDFVHGFVKGARHTSMRRHLDSRCSRCNETVKTLRKLISAALADAQYNVPEHAVHLARSIYALQKPEKVQVLPRILARLVFDSFREPAMAGVRSQQRIGRQALYEAGEYSVDLRIEQERGAPTVVLVGQIANRNFPERRVAKVPVVLKGGKEVLGRALSNAFGEFQIEYKPKQPLRLYVPVPAAGGEIEVRLQDLAEDKSPGGSN